MYKLLACMWVASECEKTNQHRKAEGSHSLGGFKARFESLTVRLKCAALPDVRKYKVNESTLFLN